jgi:hypothetical protein
MVRMFVFAAALVGTVLAGPVAAQPSAVADARQTEAIREALLRLPYYGVFDFLTFSYDRGTVVLGGYAYRAVLPDEAVRAVKRVPGVDTVTVEIKTLPASMFDDDIRWRAFYAIYTHAFLERYAPGAIWGLRHQFGPLGIFPGMQPIGTYPIHIVVEGGRVRLLGVVDNETDKTAATMAARGVAGTFGVENDLVVSPPTR